MKEIIRKDLMMQLDEEGFILDDCTWEWDHPLINIAVLGKTVEVINKNPETDERFRQTLEFEDENSAVEAAVLLKRVYSEIV